MYRVTEKLWRGPRPFTYGDLKEKGFERVIDLQSGAENFLTDKPFEYEDPEEFDLERINFDWSNIWPPSSDDIFAFLRVLGETGQKTYVHCHSGVDRTGFAIAVYRMRRMRWTFEEAHKEFVEMGRHWWFGWWKYELEEYKHGDKSYEKSL